MKKSFNYSQKRKGRGLRLSQDYSSVLNDQNRISACDLLTATVSGSPLPPKQTRRRKNKYNNQQIDGFDSKKEAVYFAQLVLLQNAADPDIQIVKIERQVVYELIPAQYDENGRLLERACRYFADFRVTRASGKVDVIDTKGVKTPEYRIKRKLMLSVFGIRVMEV